LPLSRESSLRECLRPIKVFCDSILWFADWEHYQNTYNCLENAYEAHNDWFDQQTIGMSDEDAENYAASIGFDEDQPLINFELFQNFYSYRRWLRNIETALANTNNNPLDYDYLVDDIMATLVARNRCIRINNTLYYYHNDDEVYFTNSEDCFLINLLTQNPEQAMQQYEGEINASAQKKIFNEVCQHWLHTSGKEKGTNQYVNNQKYFWKIKFKYQIPNFTVFNHYLVLKSKMINYRRFNLTGYIPRRIKMQNNNGANLYNMTDCNSSNSMGALSGEKRRIRLVSKSIYGSPYELFIVNQSARAEFTVNLNNQNLNQTYYIILQ